MHNSLLKALVEPFYDVKWIEEVPGTDWLRTMYSLEENF